MKSYASVDRKEGSYVVCEVELMELENSQVENCDKAVEMIDIPLVQPHKLHKNLLFCQLKHNFSLLFPFF